MSDLILFLAVMWVASGLVAWNYEMRDVPTRDRTTFDYVMLALCMLGGPFALAIVLMDS